MRRLWRLETLALLIVTALLLVPATVLASGGGGHGDPYINWWGFDAHAPAVGWLIVDFAIFLGILVYFGRKPMAEFLQSRALKVKRAIEEANAAKAKAEARAAELEQRLKELDGEIKGLHEEIRKSGEREREKLEDEGKRAAERMVRDTDMQVRSEVARAREALKADAVALAMQLAEQQLRGQLTAADYQRLNEEFVQTFTTQKEGDTAQL